MTAGTLAIACGANAETSAGQGEGGSGGIGAFAGSGGDGATGAGASQGFGAACGGCEDLETNDCFCDTDLAGWMCGSGKSIDDVLEPSCPGPLLYPISESCPIGGLHEVGPWGEDFFYETYAYFFDRDTAALVGLSFSTDTTVCDDASEYIQWGITSPSCALCDPCGDNPDYPACPP